MAQFPKNRYFKVLVVMHRCGILSLPHYYEAEWKNWAHRNCYRNLVFLIQILFLLSQTVVTFCYAVHELSQFLQRLLEWFISGVVVPSNIILSLKVDSTLDLLHRLDSDFSKANRRVYDKYRRKEIFTLTYVGCLLALLSVISIVDAVFPSKETVVLMARLYHRTNPVRLFPFMVWIPLVDTNQWTAFLVVTLFEIHMIFTAALAIAQIIVMEAVFTQPLSGQFEMLSTYVKLLGVEHRNEEGRLIRYTDVKHGEYIDVDVRTTDEDSLETKIPRQRARESQEAIIGYEADFLRMIVMRQQTLITFLNLYYAIMIPVMDAMALSVLGILALSVYQLFILSALSPITRVKIFLEFAIMWATTLSLMEESEGVHNSFLSVAQSIQQSQWYRLRATDTRRGVCLMLRFFQSERYTVQLGGLLVHSRRLYIRILRNAYSFANFMKLMSQ